MKGLILSNTAKFTFLHKSRQLAASLFSISYGYKRYYSELKVRSWHKADIGYSGSARLMVNSIHQNSHLPKASTIALSIFSGVVIGAKRLSGLPSRPIRNLVKFHLIRPPSTPGNSFFR